ncbi:hypothetical protein [Amycolatopsis sp. NPDC051716]|uniref:hypothetical protein n=1 Tax=Amycolatopsis sp. NPDC051716 TaxID=3155804 RepID=UPI0034162363
MNENYTEVDKDGITSDMPVKLRRLSKLLTETLTRLETVESMQAVTVGEQTELGERLAALAERLRMVVVRRCTCMTSPTTGSEDAFSNSTAHEEYRSR